MGHERREEREEKSTRRERRDDEYKYEEIVGRT
jgi:hypothetical protein